jgi:hypothetical protein
VRRIAALLAAASGLSPSNKNEISTQHFEVKSEHKIHGHQQSVGLAYRLVRLNSKPASALISSV